MITWYLIKPFRIGINILIIARLVFNHIYLKNRYRRS